MIIKHQKNEKIKDGKGLIKTRKIVNQAIIDFQLYLTDMEKSPATVKKYLRDVLTFSEWMGERALDKRLVMEYKSLLLRRCAPTSVNSVLASLNCFFDYFNRHELRVKNVKIQRQIFASSERELSKEEYVRLLSAAKKLKNERLWLLMQTVCSTGIRVSELRFITVEAIRGACAEIDCKGKRRCVFLPDRLCKMLMRYARIQRIKSGSIFVTRNGNPLDRSNIWSDMKKLCRTAHVSDKKVFPHNLRHLFARTYYSRCKDVVRLADILGHASVNTTRIYTMESGEMHRRQLGQLDLLRC
ncbi:MAG: tyrosine-type recombinase/integrase [Clostridia bacterium]|nr:tyrosine-type recombinase/integrase [Clostridia bacterium]